MQPKKRNNDKDYSQLIDESIANAEERRKQALEEKMSLSDQELEDITGGSIPKDIILTKDIILKSCQVQTQGMHTN